MGMRIGENTADDSHGWIFAAVVYNWWRHKIPRYTGITVFLRRYIIVGHFLILRIPTVSLLESSRCLYVNNPNPNPKPIPNRSLPIFILLSSSEFHNKPSGTFKAILLTGKYGYNISPPNCGGGGNNAVHSANNAVSDEQRQDALTLLHVKQISLSTLAVCLMQQSLVLLLSDIF